MQKIKIVLVAVPLWLAACAQTPQVTSNTATDPEKRVAQSEPEPNRNRLRCRHMSSVGSHFKRSLCKTEKEWEEERQRSADALENAAQNSMADAIQSETR